MALLIKNLHGTRRASYITTEDAEALVKSGNAYKHPGMDAYEYQESAAPEYETKEMTPALKRKRKIDFEE